MGASSRGRRVRGTDLVVVPATPYEAWLARRLARLHGSAGQKPHPRKIQSNSTAVRKLGFAQVAKLARTKQMRSAAHRELRELFEADAVLIAAWGESERARARADAVALLRAGYAREAFMAMDSIQVGLATNAEAVIIRTRTGAQSGRKRKRGRQPTGPAAATLIKELNAMHKRNRHLSWSAACERIGDGHELSRQTVALRAGSAKW